MGFFASTCIHSHRIDKPPMFDPDGSELQDCVISNSIHSSAMKILYHIKANALTFHLSPQPRLCVDSIERYSTSKEKIPWISGVLKFFVFYISTIKHARNVIQTAYCRELINLIFHVKIFQLLGHPTPGLGQKWVKIKNFQKILEKKV